MEERIWPGPYRFEARLVAFCLAWQVIGFVRWVLMSHVWLAFSDLSKSAKHDCNSIDSEIENVVSIRLILVL